MTMFFVALVLTMLLVTGLLVAYLFIDNLNNHRHMGAALNFVAMFLVVYSLLSVGHIVFEHYEHSIIRNIWESELIDD